MPIRRVRTPRYPMLPFALRVGRRAVFVLLAASSATSFARLAVAQLALPARENPVLAPTDASLDVTATAQTGALTLQADPGCTPDWLPTFGGAPGANASIFAFTVFD